MAAGNRNRHFYADQQEPFEEPVDPGHSKVKQEAFARKPPTPEDNYFRDEERRRLLPKSPPVTVGRSEERPDGKTLFERLYRAIARAFDPDWRP